MKVWWLKRGVASVIDNALWKIVSVVGAILLWFALVDSPELVTSIFVPIEFANIPRSLTIGNQLPDQVQLQVRGPRDALANDSFRRTAVLLDLSAMKPGERTFNVPDSVVGLPARLTLVEAVPFQLQVVLEPHLRREIPVRLRLKEDATTPIKVRVVRSEINPATILISGPESHVKSVPYAMTDQFDFGTMLNGDGRQVLEARLQTFVENPRVRIDSVSLVNVKVVVERIPD